MSEKKNIDRLFQEKFKDFEVAPPENLWNNIEAELQKKKKRRVIPLWFRLSGVAAILIIGLLLVLPSREAGKDNNQVVIDNTDVNEQEGVIKSPTIESQVKTEEGIVQGNEASQKALDINTAQDATSQGQAAPVSGRSGTATDKLSSAGTNNAVVYNGKQAGTNKQKSKNKTVRSSTIAPAVNEGVAYNNQADKRTIGNNSNNLNAENNPIQKSESQNDSNGIANESKLGIADNANTAKNEGQTVITNEDKNKLPEEAISNNELNKDALAVTEIPVDSTAVPAVNELEDLLKKKQEEEKEEAVADAGSKEKWNLRPQVAPLFYNTMSEGSPIDQQFASNSKSYDADMSYGVGVDYALNERLSIRSGINNINLSYSTNDVAFHASLSEQTNNVAAKGMTANIVVESHNAVGTGDATGITSFAANSFSNQTFNGSMQQEMGYIEVPLEMSYKLLNKKFGIELIGGMSTLFLNNNNISVLSDQGYRSEIGEASNLNDVSFSANAGIGFKYRFLKMFEASFEPTLKYQMNTFSANAGNFKPYFIGLYSGLSFRF